MIHVIQLFPSCSSPQSAPCGLTIVFGLIILCFYIVRKGSNDHTLAAYARGNIYGHETLLRELERETQTITDKKEIKSLKKISLKVKSRLETYRRVYKIIKKIQNRKNAPKQEPSFYLSRYIISVAFKCKDCGSQFEEKRHLDIYKQVHGGRPKISEYGSPEFNQDRLRG